MSLEIFSVIISSIQSAVCVHMDGKQHVEAMQWLVQMVLLSGAPSQRSLRVINITSFIKILFFFFLFKLKDVEGIGDIGDIVQSL